MERLTRRTCITLGGLPVLAALAGCGDSDSGVLEPPAAASARERLQQLHLPNVPLITNEGERVRFYDDLVKDKKVVLTFVSTRAPAWSAKVTQNLAALQWFFADRVGKDILLYSISRTPRIDSPAALRTWARRSAAGPGWRFLTGDPADVERLRRSLGFASDDAAEDADPAYSVGQLRYGVEPEMRWAHCASQAPPRMLAHSMLLDFGPDAAQPQWNCDVALAGLG